MMLQFSTKANYFSSDDRTIKQLQKGKALLPQKKLPKKKSPPKGDKAHLA